MNQTVPSTVLAALDTSRERRPHPWLDRTVHAVIDLLLHGATAEEIPSLLGLRQNSVIRSVYRAIARAERDDNVDWLDTVRAVRVCLLADDGTPAVAQRRRQALTILRTRIGLREAA